MIQTAQPSTLCLRGRSQIQNEYLCELQITEGGRSQSLTRMHLSSNNFIALLRTTNSK